MTDISERRSFRLLPDGDIGFAKPALEYRTAGGEKDCHNDQRPLKVADYSPRRPKLGDGDSGCQEARRGYGPVVHSEPGRI